MTDRGVAIVTGGASGIGLAIAKALLGDGWKVIIADLAQGPLDAARAELEPLRANATKSVIMDVADEASVIAALDGCEDGFGPVRGLVNSAGIGRDTPFVDTSVEVFRKVLDINLTGTFIVAREAGKLMRTHGGGAIINIASISGQRGNLGRSKRRWSRPCRAKWTAPPGFGRCRSGATPRQTKLPAPRCSCSTTGRQVLLLATFSMSMAVSLPPDICRIAQSHSSCKRGEFRYKYL